MKQHHSYDEDAHLLLKISQGEQAAFQALFEKYRNQLFVYLYKIVKSKEASEEMVLDVFLKVWHGRASIMEIEHFSGFLYRVAHNKAIDFLRSVRQQAGKEQEIWELMQAPEQGEAADKQLLLKNTEEIIDQAVGRLTPQRQKVFYLHHHHHFSNEQIAHKLNLSKNTVRNHLFASMEFIRKYVSMNLQLLLLVFLLKK